MYGLSPCPADISQMKRMSGGALVKTRMGIPRTSVSVIAKGWPSAIMASQVALSALITAVLIVEQATVGHPRLLT